MDTGRISLRKYSGYPSEDPDQFLSDFTAYCTFSRISGTDNRKVAAFQLHLQGPAQTWFCCLDEDVKGDWETLKDAFEQQYCVANNPPVLLVETEQFNNLKLQPNHQIEDYFCKVIEKGNKIQKSDQEILLKFIQGLPDQLAFFVRAGNPSDVQAALTSAKMGEAFGYRFSSGLTSKGNQPATASVAAATRADDRITSLEQTVNKLGDTIERLLVSPKQDLRDTSHNSGRNSISANSARVCYNCSCSGHIRRRCNLASGTPNPNSTCQLCSQRGHAATQCKLFVNIQSSNSENSNHPRNTRRGPLGEQQ
ncbi:MAG: hypothetical protein N0E48_18270 [Candidatus Thiodiazotropha endolucinida]|nr:hypothetical protein [Candidatus Thiodiazotropha taylori]MCW4345281.1 hypothetical protein [Candidatus Thiodiazotropha endolucinida]